MKKLLLLFSHGLVLVIGFAAGFYLLPILTQPPPPSQKAIGAIALKALHTGQFQRKLKGSDALHYGDGTFYISKDRISFEGSLSPGPDYRVYFSPVFVESKADFLAHKASMVQVGEVKTFHNFIVKLPAEINADNYNTVIVWCESFQQFITAGRY